MSAFSRAVLMGDPTHFQIRGGANPHTRDRWGRRKIVDPARARAQFDQWARRLTEAGVSVFVVPPVATSPGLVFPANAGFLTRLEAPVPLDQKIFLLSRALPTREAERRVYRDFLRGLGFTVNDTFPYRFEGEADLFAAGSLHIFTSGPLESQRFVPRWGWPPYRRVYGFRSDPAAKAQLSSYVDTPVLSLTLVNEAFYHGDTCLCSFGRRREFLMAYLPALNPESQEQLKDAFRERLLVLDDDDGWAFAANSFQLGGENPILFMPHTVSRRLQDQVRERGVTPELVDVSEFMTKGGGSVKCMIGDLGPLPPPATPAVENFRRTHRFL